MVKFSMNDDQNKRRQILGRNRLRYLASGLEKYTCLYTNKVYIHIG